MRDIPKGSKVTVNGQDHKILCGERSNYEKLSVNILTAVAVVTTGHMGVTPLDAISLASHPYIYFRSEVRGIKKIMTGSRDYNAICPCELCRDILYDSYACCIHLDQCVKLRVNNSLPMVANSL